MTQVQTHNRKLKGGKKRPKHIICLNFATLITGCKEYCQMTWEVTVQPNPGFHIKFYFLTSQSIQSKLLI